MWSLMLCALIVSMIVTGIFSLFKKDSFVIYAVKAYNCFMFSFVFALSFSMLTGKMLVIRPFQLEMMKAEWLEEAKDEEKTEATNGVEINAVGDAENITMSDNLDISSIKVEDGRVTEINGQPVSFDEQLTDNDLVNIIEDVKLHHCNLDHCLTENTAEKIKRMEFICDNCRKIYKMLDEEFHKVKKDDHVVYLCENCYEFTCDNCDNVFKREQCHHVKKNEDNSLQFCDDCYEKMKKGF